MDWNFDLMRTPRRYAAAKHDLWAGLLRIMEQMSEDEAAGKSDADVVLLTGQRMEGLIFQIGLVLKGAE